MQKSRPTRAIVRTRAHHNRREILRAVALTVFAVAVMAGFVVWPKA